MDGKIINLSARIAARTGLHFTPRETIQRIIAHAAPPPPEVTNYQAIEGQGLRRQTPGGWVWMAPEHGIDCGTGETFIIHTASFWKGCFTGGAAVLLIALAAIAVLAAMTAEICR